VPAGGAGEVVVVAEGDAGVVVAEQAALAQDGDHVLGEELKAGREHGRHHVEAVRGARLGPLLYGVRHLLRRASECAVAAAPA
jgi:hypothetical protein